jgi:hypothetical protein
MLVAGALVLVVAVLTVAAQRDTYPAHAGGQ